MQFDYSIVTVLWVLMSLGLTYAGIKIEHEKLFYSGYFGFIIPFLRVIFYDLWFIEDVQRWIAIGGFFAGYVWIICIALKLSCCCQSGMNSFEW